MRLLTVDGQGRFIFETFNNVSPPPYAILSHVWLEAAFEVTFDDIVSADGRAQRKRGYEKLEFCKTQLAKDGLKYFWADTCCIRKSDQYELSTAINSMFRWYRDAAVCYVYLADVFSDNDLEQSRWFTRGWTLQELVAPRNVIFFTRAGEELGTKTSLLRRVSMITGIPEGALQGAPLSSFDSEDIFTWAANRKVTVEVDKAYCLVGILDLSFIPYPGETEDQAWHRLREEVSKKKCTEEPKQETVSVDMPLRTNTHVSATHEGRRHRGMTEDDFRELLHFDEIDARLVDIEPPLSKTCEWILQDPEYLTWLSEDGSKQHHGFLWINGNAGCGKSTLTKFIWRHLTDTMDGSHVLSFFFNARGAKLEKTTLGLYRSLVIQLLDVQPQAFDQLDASTLREIQRQGIENSEESLTTLIRDLLPLLKLHKIIIIIDALDECAESEVRDMISLWEDLGELAAGHPRSLRVLFASRPYPRITIDKALFMDMGDRLGHTADLKHYISKKLKGAEQESMQKIVNDVLARSSGIFLWVVLVVPKLNESLDHGRGDALQEKLREMPPSLGQLFHDMLCKDNKHMDEVKLCLQWLLFAQRPLTPVELYLAIKSGLRSQTAWREVSEEESERYILSCSKGLAQIVRPQDFEPSMYPTVQFIHEFVTDFLLKDNGLAAIWTDLRGSLLGRSHDALKECSLYYLNSIKRQKSSRRFWDDFFLDPWAFPFLLYTVNNVLYHAEEAARNGINQAQFIDIFEMGPWMGKCSPTELKDRFPEDVDLFYILADRGYRNLLEASSKDPFKAAENPNCRYRNPLVAAVMLNRAEVLEALVMRDRERRPLDGTYPYNVHELWNCLFDGERRRKGDLDREDAILRFFRIYYKAYDWAMSFAPDKLLLFAASNGVDQIVLDVLTRTSPTTGVKVNLLASALVAATVSGHVKAVLCLLEHGADVNASATTGKYGTALIAASGNSNNRLVQLLLDRGADVNAVAVTGAHGTALIAAICERRIDILHLLLDEGVDVNALATTGARGTALIAAVENLNENLVRLLLDKGADVNALAMNGHYGTALIAAVQNDRDNVVHLLLDKGANVNALAITGWDGTALIAASGKGNLSIMSLLLDNGADVNASTSIPGQNTAVIAAMYATSLVSGIAQAVKLLIDRGAEVNLVTKDSKAPTALAGAIKSLNKLWWIEDERKDRMKIVRQVLDAGADASLADGAALLAAADWRFVEAMSLLLDRCAHQIDTQAEYYAKAVKLAKQSEWEAGPDILSMLLKHQAASAQAPSSTTAGPGSAEESNYSFNTTGSTS